MVLYNGQSLCWGWFVVFNHLTDFLHTSSCAPIIYQAGNKADLEGRRKVDFNEANAYAEENGILHMETSAKNSNNVRDLFVEIAKTLPKATQQPDREAFPIMPQKQESRNCC